MKSLATVYVFTIAMVASFAALAQYPDRGTELIVPGTHPADLRRATASIFATALGRQSGARIKVRPLPYSHFKAEVSPRTFSAQDGSQLALTSLDSAGSLPDFLSEVTIVALLARVDLALFVRDGSDIAVLKDFTTLNNREPLVVGVRRTAAKFAARRTFERLGVPARYIPFESSSEARQALASGAIDVLIDVVSLSRPQFRPIAAFSPVPVASVPTARGQGIDVDASRDYVLVAPAGLDREVYERISEDLKNLLGNSRFLDDLSGLPLRGDYVEGSVYVAQRQEILNDLCATCDCDDSECDDCSRCK